jgi:hypothetical protein
MNCSKWISAAALGCAAVLTACGGGGGSSGTNPFGSGTTTGPSVSDLDVTVSSVQLANTPSSKVTVTVAALDSGKRTVAGASVRVSVAPGSDAVVTQVTSSTNTTTGTTTVAPGGTTNASGIATADVSVGANRANRSVTILATSGSITKSVTIQVVGASISSTVSAPVVAPGAAGSIRYRVVDQANNPMSNQAVQISAVGLVSENPAGNTDLNGEYVYRYTAPAGTGGYNVTASIAGASNQQTISVQPASTVPDAQGTISSASVSASPSVVAINVAGSTQNRSEIRALFLGANNAPIANVRAKFDLNGDVNSIGGTFTAGTGSAPLYSDANGVVRSAYIPSSRPSPTNGVTVRVCYAKTDAEFSSNPCPNAAFVSLTVVNDALGVTIGRDENILEGTLTYIKQYVVSVVDSAGNAKPDVNLSVSVDLPTFYKGNLCIYNPVTCTAPGITAGWLKFTAATCSNEDLNRNGVLETGEDLDNDQRLEPGKSDVSVRLLSSKTGVDGLAVLQIEYPRNFGLWVVANITVNASGVSGTEGRATYVQDPVPVPTSALANASNEPAFIRSPYGVKIGCSDPG